MLHKHIISDGQTFEMVSLDGGDSWRQRSQLSDMVEERHRAGVRVGKSGDLDKIAEHQRKVFRENAGTVTRIAQMMVRRFKRGRKGVITTTNGEVI